MKCTKQVMGMPITVELLTDNQETETVINAVFSHFRQADETFSTYKTTSQISKINQGVIQAKDTSDVVRKVLSACETATEKTNGYFNIWHNGLMDPSGYVKGWAIDGAVKIIQTHRINDFFVDAGGDVYAAGNNTKGAKWRIGIKHPSQPKKYVKVVGLCDRAIATSGIYERGKHIYNPHSGLPVDDPVSLSVIGANIIEADVIATAAFAMGPSEGLRFIAKSGLEGLAVTRDGQVLMTSGFDSYVE